MRRTIKGIIIFYSCDAHRCIRSVHAHMDIQFFFFNIINKDFNRYTANSLLRDYRWQNLCNFYFLFSYSFSSNICNLNTSHSSRNFSYEFKIHLN